MKMSCNGCRVLRKGCSDDCTIRPCLYWIASPDSQANATLFLAKFYGRAGLLNLINAGPPHLRPAIFKSLLYEACGRIVNPVDGTVGLLCSGNWSRCEAAVDGVLRGTTTIPDGQCSGAVTPIASALSNPAIKAFDIRHVSKDPTSVGSTPTKPRSKPRPTDHINNNNNNNKVAIHNFMMKQDTSSPAPETNPSPAMNFPADQEGVGLELSLGIGHQ